MDPVSQLVGAMEAPRGPGVATGYVVTIIGKGLAGREPRCLADNLVALDHQSGVIRVFNHPLSPIKGHGPVRSVPDRDVVDERMRLVRGKAGPAVVIAQLVEAGSETGEFLG